MRYRVDHREKEVTIAREMVTVSVLKNAGKEREKSIKRKEMRQ